MVSNIRKAGVETGNESISDFTSLLCDKITPGYKRSNCKCTFIFCLSLHSATL